jgi:hypothetical protein
VKSGTHSIARTLLADFAGGRCGAEAVRRIQRLRAEDPSADALFFLVESLSGAGKAGDLACVEPCRVSEIDPLLSRALAGRATPEEARRFLGSILHSEVFYGHLVRKLAASSTIPLNEPVPELAGIELLPESELLRQVVGGSRTLSAGRDFREWASRKFIFTNPFPRYAAVLAAAAILIWLLPRWLVRPPTPEEAVLKRAVPFPFAASGMRSTENDRIGFAAEPLVRRFEAGMSDYVLGNFDKAIAVFRAGEKDTAGLFQSGSAAPWLRDYYFYWGCSHMALVRKHRRADVPGDPDVEESVRLFLSAYQTAARFSLEGEDRERFYLGLARGLAGKNEEAREDLSLIRPESRYYRDARDLLEQGLNPKGEGGKK